MNFLIRIAENLISNAFIFLLFTNHKISFLFLIESFQLKHVLIILRLLVLTGKWALSGLFQNVSLKLLMPVWVLLPDVNPNVMVMGKVVVIQRFPEIKTRFKNYRPKILRT